jgi:hypothetical protein
MSKKDEEEDSTCTYGEYTSSKAGYGAGTTESGKRKS